MEIKRCGDDVVDYKIDICDPYSFRKLKQDVFSSYRNKRNAGFDISNVYEDFGEMLVMGVNTLVLDYYYLISELSKKFKVIMLGEDFGLSSVSYLLGLSTYNSGQLKTNIEYGQFWPSRLSFGIDRSKASDFEEAIRAFDTDEHGNLPGVNEKYGEDSNRVETIKMGQRPVTIKVRYIDTKRFRLLTDNEPDYSALPFPKIAADTLYDLLDGKTECYRIGEESAELIEPLLTMFKPESFKELEQVCALLLASRDSADVILKRRESGFEHWEMYLSKESFARFVFGIDGYYDDAVRLISRMDDGTVGDEDIEILKDLGTSDDVINDICKMRSIPCRAFAADLARIVWRSQLEKNAISELRDFWPLSDDPDTDDREQEILDRIPCTDEGMKAVKDYLESYESYQARDRLREIREELNWRRFAGI